LIDLEQRLKFCSTYLSKICCFTIEFLDIFLFSEVRITGHFVACYCWNHCSD